MALSSEAKRRLRSAIANRAAAEEIINAIDSSAGSVASGNNTFSGNNTHSGTETFTNITMATAAAVTKTADYTLLAADSGKHFDNTGAAGTVIFTLPAVATSEGFFYWIHCVENQLVTIAAPTGTLVGANNAARDSVSTGASGHRIGCDFFVFCNGTNWFVHADVKGLTAPVYA